MDAVDKALMAMFVLVILYIFIGNAVMANNTKLVLDSQTNNLSLIARRLQGR